MTAPLRGTPHLSAAPASQNTAPVAEFRCLFTHDIRRKQKRWQDGYLKFHTFNNRVMVYDQTRYFLGDTYYKDSNELHEGDELTLDKGIMVEVADAIGVTQTDLTPLFDKMPKDSPARANATAPPRPFQPPSSVAPSNASRAASQLRHKSLNALLGTPKGPIGKAVPMQSPYEARKDKEKENGWEGERTVKRQKVAQYPSSRVSSPPLEDFHAPKKDLLPSGRPSAAKGARAPPNITPQEATIITLDSASDQDPIISSGVTIPCMSPGAARSKLKSSALQASPLISSRQHVAENPVAKTPKIPRGKVPVPHVKAMETPTRPVPSSSPPVSASNRLTNVDFALQSAARSPWQDSPIQHLPAPKPQKESVPPPSPPRNPKTKSLRLSAGVKRGTLLCQLPSQQASSAGSQSGLSTRRHQATRISPEGSKTISPLPLDSQVKPTISTNTLVPPNTKRKAITLPTNETSKRTRISSPSLNVSLDIFDDPELVHGFLDQQLVVPSSSIGLQHPKQCPSPLISNAAKRTVAITDEPTRKKGNARKISPSVNIKHGNAQLVSLSPEGVAQKAVIKKKVISIAEPVRKAPSLVASIPEPSQSPSREVDPTHPTVFETHSTNLNTSPRKLPYSTGGFRKKPEHNQPQSKYMAPAPETASPPRNGSIILPPRPPRARKKGPLMTTTELAALLQKPENPSKDTTEDEEHQSRPKKSPGRSFRRVRSENDAPIPSTSEEWERCNLPKSRTREDVEVNANLEAGVGKKSGGLAALVKKTDPRRKFQRTRSLTVDTSAYVGEGKEVDLPTPDVDKDVGPWSTEAFDLFDWRPPPKVSETSG